MNADKTENNDKLMDESQKTTSELIPPELKTPHFQSREFFLTYFVS